MFEKDKIYISRVDSKGRIFLWKCSKNDTRGWYSHFLVISKNGILSYEEKLKGDTHGWDGNVLATEEEANWLEQCILNPNLNGKNIKDIPLLKKEINYEIY